MQSCCKPLQAGPSTVHELVSKDDEEGVQVLLAAGTPVDIRDDEGCTALHFAADRGHVAIAQALIRAGADVNAQDNDGQAPLHYAALCAQEEVRRSVGACDAGVGACSRSFAWVEGSKTVATKAGHHGVGVYNQTAGRPF